MGSLQENGTLTKHLHNTKVLPVAETINCREDSAATENLYCYQKILYVGVVLVLLIPREQKT